MEVSGQKFGVKSEKILELIFNDPKLMIINDGLLPDGLTVEDLKKQHLSIPRNYLLCDIFYKAGMIESWGSGTLKVIKLCRDSGLKDPEFEMGQNSFSITFRRQDKVTDKVTDNQLKILKEIAKNSHVSTAELAHAVGISQRKIKENLTNPTLAPSPKGGHA